MTFNPTFVNQVGSDRTSQPIPKSDQIIGRVVHVVHGPFLEGSTMRDVYYNDPTDLGKILFQQLGGTQITTADGAGNISAKPLNSATKHTPLEGEFVYIIPGPGLGLNENQGTRDYYYLPPFNLWGASHHNALPDLTDYSNYTNEAQQTYQESKRTNTTRNLSTSASIDYPLGPNFTEKSNVKSLRLFIGDVTMEGRWGNSIRFGSTSTDASKNNWSKSTTPGNPITIIKNGQGPQSDEDGWIPTVEDINVDPSSIYLTEGQEIVIDDIQNNFSLTSFQINLQTTITNTIPIQQQLTSTDYLSAADQDKRINNNV